MRMRFEKDLRSFSEVAKEELTLDEKTDKELGDFSSVVDWHLKKAAERQHTDTETQQEIYGIQKEKQEIMRRLKEQLACLDNPECRIEKEKEERSAEFDDLADAFMYRDDNNQKCEATFGEIMTDMDWGVHYQLDERNTPRSMSKQYLVERTKKQLMELLDSQIIKSEAGGDISHEWRREAYRRVEEDRAQGEEKEKLGFVSEMLVKNLLKKMSIDGKAPFQIRDSDVFQDVEQKIDFILHRKQDKRGVRVEGDENREDVGIQFSINLQAAEKKKRQVQRAKKELEKTEEHEHIDDIVLVMFPLNIAGALRNKWKKDGRPAGGPDKFLRQKMAKEIFTNLTKNILTPDEINTSWDQYKNNFPEN